MTVLKVLLGVVLGAGIAFGSLFLPLHFILNSENSQVETAKPAQKTHAPANGHKNPTPKNQPASSTSDTLALIVAAIGAAIGGVYSAIAFGRGVYALRPFSIIGYMLDMSWSLLNTTASLLVWLPVCAVAGGDFCEPSDSSRRSGTFVYEKNPRGGGYDATTIGTVIAGGWSSHEETHVWQARIFGPAYLIIYITSLLLNMLFRLCTGKTDELANEAYYRICFEDWAYFAGESSARCVEGKMIDIDHINWGAWVLWFALTAVYVSTFALIVVGALAGTMLLGIIAAAVLVAYSLIRAVTPTHADVERARLQKETTASASPAAA